MASAAKTTDHDTIRHWAEERGGHPATVKGTGSHDDPGILRIDFPGSSEDSLEPVEWDEFFEKFDSNHLAFLYQEEKDGKTSRFCKFVHRDE